MIAGAIALLVACGEMVPPAAVTGVTVEEAAVSLTVGETHGLTAAVTVVGGADDSVSWSSGDAGVVSVASADAHSATLTATGVGTTTVTVTSVVDAGKRDTVAVTVGPAPAVTGVDIEGPASLSIAVGDPPHDLTAAASVVGGADDDVSWSSSDPSVVSVAAVDGHAATLTAVAVGGPVTVTATSVADPKVFATVAVTVLDGEEPFVASVEIDGPAAVTLVEGDTHGLTAVVTVVGGASDAVSWSSDDATVVSVASANAHTVTLTAEAVGTAAVTVTSVEDVSKFDTVTVTVDPAPAVTGVEVAEESVSMTVGDTHGLTVVVSVVGGADDAVTWTSDDASVATVAPADAHDVTVTAVGAGSATLTVTSVVDPTRSDTVVVIVTEPPSASIWISSATVISGSRVHLVWDASNAASFDVYAVPDDVAEAPDLLAGPLGGSAREQIVAIPASDRQTLRVVAHGAADDAQDEIVPVGVVLTSRDSDPYAAGGRTPDPAPVGSLRYVLATVPDGATIGFAADVPGVDLYGVELTSDLGPGGVFHDAHLVLARDVTISGPVSVGPGAYLRVLESAFDGTGAFDGTIRDVTWRSRVIYVGEGVTVTLENLEIGGGRFIYSGAGIRNDGTLVLENVHLNDNRAWGIGGGIYNGGTLTMGHVQLSGSDAATSAGEDQITYEIRNDPTLGEITVGLVSGWGGGVYNAAGATATVSDSILGGNRAKVSGGGAYNEGEMSLTGSDVSMSVADRTAFSAPNGYCAGGAIYTEGDLTFSNGVMAENAALWFGGALFVDADGSAVLTSAVIQDNGADVGGGIRHEYWSDETGDNLQLDAVTTVVDNLAYSGVGHNISSEAIPPPAAEALGVLGDGVPPGRATPSSDPIHER